MRCGCCGKAGIRKTQQAYVIENGRVVGKRVGDCCAAKGVTIVSSKLAPVVQDTARRDQKEVLAPFVKALEGRLRVLAKTPGLRSEDEERGIRETLEDVVHMLKEGRA